MSDALRVLRSLVLEDGRRWGEAAAAFQVEDAEAVLDEASPTPYHWMGRSRGGSKTADLAGMAISAMVAQLPPGSRLYALAADQDQGRLLLDSVEGYARRTPELRGALDVQAFRVVAVRTGSVLDVLPADEAGSWGIRPAFLLVDEIAQWSDTRRPRKLWESVSSAATKIAGARMVVASTAGEPGHFARTIRDHALRDPLWRVHEVAGPPPWADPARLAEQRRRLPESLYARLFDNVWTEAEDRLVDRETLRAAVRLPGPVPPEPGRRYAIGLDVGLKHDRTVAAVATGQRLADGRTAVALVRLGVWSGSRLRPVRLAEVEAWLDEQARAYLHAEIVADPYQAVGLLQRLGGRGLRVREFAFTAASVGRLASTLFQLLRNREVLLPDDEALLDELAHVRLRESSPGVLRLDHDAGRHDDRAIALALAASAVVETEASISSWPGEASVGTDGVSISEALGLAPWSSSGGRLADIPSYGGSL